MGGRDERDEAVTRMIDVWRALRRGPSTIALRDALYGTGDRAIEPTHMDVMDLLATRDPWRMSELAAALQVDPSTMTRTLQRMEANDLATRSHTTADGRVVTVAMTPEGRQRHAQVAAVRATMVRRVLDAFDADDQAQLVGLNERFLASLDRVIGEAAARGPAV